MVGHGTRLIDEIDVEPQGEHITTTGKHTTPSAVEASAGERGLMKGWVPVECQELTNVGEMTGRSRYGAGTLASADGQRHATVNELKIARFQGKHVAEITSKLAA
jgi:NAD(P)H dehydrogenase (quinone)